MYLRCKFHVQLYIKTNFKKTKRGQEAYNVCIALGSLTIKEWLGLSDEETVNQITENSYLQYFLGFEFYTEEQFSYSSQLTHITEYLYKKYGEYTSVSKEVENMVTTLYNPAIKEEGIREGMKKGIEKGRKNVAINMLKENLDIDLVVKFTGLPKEEIINLRQEIDEQAY